MARERVNLDDGTDETFVDGDINEGDDVLDQAIDFESIRGIMCVPRDMYHLKVQGAKPALSKAKLPKIQCMFTVLEGEFEGAKIPQDLSLAPGAIDRTRNHLVGMGLPSNAHLSPRAIAEALKEDGGLEFWAILDVQKSDQINPDTGEVYDDRNRIVRTSTSPIASMR